MERLGDDARDLLRGAGVPDAGVLAAVVRAWPGAVGPAVSRAAWPLRIARDGTLHVATVSSTWAFELTTLAAEVRESLAGALGPTAPASLRFAPGPVPEPAAADAGSGPPTAPVPTSDEEATGRAVASAIEDDDLREIVRRAAVASLAAHRSDRDL